MGEFIAGVAVTAFAVFIYKKIEESKEKRANRKPGSGGAGGRSPNDSQQQVR